MTTLRQLARKPGFVVAGLFLIALFVVAIFPSLITNQDPFQQNLQARLLPPGSVSSEGTFHLLGTDSLGRDVFSRLIVGARVSLIILACVLPISALIGVTMGIVAGYRGGILDRVVSRLIDIRLAVPFILILLTVMAVLGPGLANMIIVLSLMQWVDYSKLSRAEALALKDREFVQAARILGATQARQLIRHVLPNAIPTIIVVMTIEAPALILTEASLSFLGIGVPPQTPSWGQMLSSARAYIFIMPSLAALPGIAITLTILAANVVGDALRDHFDPFLRSRN